MGVLSGCSALNRIPEEPIEGTFDALWMTAISPVILGGALIVELAASVVDESGGDLGLSGFFDMYFKDDDEPIPVI